MSIFGNSRFKPSGLNLDVTKKDGSDYLANEHIMDPEYSF